MRGGGREREREGGREGGKIKRKGNRNDKREGGSRSFFCTFLIFISDCSFFSTFFPFSSLCLGGKAGVLFLIQRDDCFSFSACDLDPAYGKI